MSKSNSAAKPKWRMHVSNVVLLLGLIPACGTILALFGPIVWIADLFVHFKVQYAIALALAVIVLLGCRRWYVAIAFSALVVWNLIPILPMYFGGVSVTSPADFRVFLANVNTQEGSPSQLLSEIQHYSPDVILLQEVNGRWISELDALGGTFAHRILRPRDDNFGIALYSRHPLQREAIEYWGPAAVPSIVATIAINSKPVHVIGTHALPPADARNAEWRDRQLAEIANFVNGIDGAVLVAGDLNTTPWSRQFRRLLDDTGLRNTAQGFGIQATWPVDSIWFRIPLDHGLASDELSVIDREVGPDIGSDHYPVVIDLSFRS